MQAPQCFSQCSVLFSAVVASRLEKHWVWKLESLDVICPKQPHSVRKRREESATQIHERRKTESGTGL